MQATFPRLTSTEMTLRIANDAATITPITLVAGDRLGGDQQNHENVGVSLRSDHRRRQALGQCSVKPPPIPPNSSPGIFFGAQRLQWEATRQDDRVFTLRCIFTAEMIREWSALSALTRKALREEMAPEKWTTCGPVGRLERVNE